MIFAPFAFQNKIVVPSGPTIDTNSLKIWYDVGNTACYDGVSTTLNNLVTGGTFNTATQANTGAGTITINATERSVGFNQTTNAGQLQYAYQNTGNITRSNGFTYWGFIKKNSGTYRGQWCFLNRYANSIAANLLIDVAFRDGIRSEYNTGSSGYITVWNTKTITAGTWYFVAYTVNISASAQITMVQSDDTTATSSTFNNSSPSSYTPTQAGFGMNDSVGTFNWSIGAHGVYEKTMTETEMRAIRTAYTSLGYYV